MLKIKFQTDPNVNLKEEKLDLIQNSNNMASVTQVKQLYRLKRECKTRPEFFFSSLRNASV